VEVGLETPLQQLMFEDIQVVGAVVGPADCPSTVRARRGVQHGTGDLSVSLPLPTVDMRALAAGDRLCFSQIVEPVADCTMTRLDGA
jgi:hypothetical protein